MSKITDAAVYFAFTLTPCQTISHVYTNSRGCAMLKNSGCFYSSHSQTHSHVISRCTASGCSLIVISRNTEPQQAPPTSSYKTHLILAFVLTTDIFSLLCLLHANSETMYPIPNFLPSYDLNYKEKISKYQQDTSSFPGPILHKVFPSHHNTLASRGWPRALRPSSGADSLRPSG